MFSTAGFRTLRAAMLGVLVTGTALVAPVMASPPSEPGATPLHQTPSGPPGSASAPAQAPAPPSAGPTAPSATDITQGVWQWLRTEYSNDTTIAAPDPSRYTISLLPGGRLAIRADCNQGSGTYTLNGPQLTLNPGALTLIACPTGSQEKVFLDDLKNVATYVMDGETLVLNLRVDSGNMVFQPEPSASLTGRTWRVQSYNNGRGALSSVVGGAEIDATFDEEGGVNGNTGCNLYRGAYTIDGSGLTVSQVVSTRRACTQPELNEQEQAFLRALEASTSYQLVGDRLTLSDAAGTRQLVLVRPSV